MRMFGFVKLMPAEYKSGATFGSIGGIMKFLEISPTAMEAISKIFVVAVTALVSGFLGALGAHIFKILVKKYKQR